MMFGLALKQCGASIDGYAEIAVAAEGLGFESLWVSEHLVLPATLPASYPYSDDGRVPVSAGVDEYDPWVVLAAMAGVTSSIRLATNIFILPLHHPVTTARSVMTVDRVSGGRATLGVGVGWLEEEFTAVGADFRNRGARADEAIAVIRHLWYDEVTEFHGHWFDIPPVRFEPKPVQLDLPIEVGGMSRAALRRAGRLGDGWIEFGAPGLHHLAEQIGRLELIRREAGREHRPFTVTCCDAPLDLPTIRRYGDAGVTRIVMHPPSADHTRSPHEVIDWLEKQADGVLSKV